MGQINAAAFQNPEPGQRPCLHHFGADFPCLHAVSVGTVGRDVGDGDKPFVQRRSLIHEHTEAAQDGHNGRRLLRAGNKPFIQDEGQHGQHADPGTAGAAAKGAQHHEDGTPDQVFPAGEGNFFGQPQHQGGREYGRHNAGSPQPAVAQAVRTEAVRVDPFPKGPQAVKGKEADIYQQGLLDCFRIDFQEQQDGQHPDAADEIIRKLGQGAARIDTEKDGRQEQQRIEAVYQEIPFAVLRYGERFPGLMALIQVQQEEQDGQSVEYVPCGNGHTLCAHGERQRCQAPFVIFHFINSFP